jgi:hypothetical protein
MTGGGILWPCDSGIPGNQESITAIQMATARMFASGSTDFLGRFWDITSLTRPDAMRRDSHAGLGCVAALIGRSYMDENYSQPATEPIGRNGWASRR